jgi:hypothetical protein
MYFVVCYAMDDRGDFVRVDDCDEPQAARRTVHERSDINDPGFVTHTGRLMLCSDDRQHTDSVFGVANLRVP